MNLENKVWIIGLFAIFSLIVNTILIAKFVSVIAGFVVGGFGIIGTMLVIVL